MGRPFNSSPADRIQPGSTRNPRGLNDAVLRGALGHVTGDIRLTPSAATVVGGVGYNFGKVNDRAIGTYRLEWQGAASATAEPLGAMNRVEFTVYESTAGVYLAKVNRVGDLDGGLSATADAHQVNDAADALISATAAVDATLTFGVVDATMVTAVNTTASNTFMLAVGDLVLFDGSATGTRVFSVTRIS